MLTVVPGACATVDRGSRPLGISWKQVLIKCGGCFCALGINDWSFAANHDFLSHGTNFKVAVHRGSKSCSDNDAFFGSGLKTVFRN